MKAHERFLEYVKIHTTSEPDSESTPSARRELDLSRLLVRQLREIGLDDAVLSDTGYVYAHLPATPGCEQAPALGFVAHVDTAPCFKGEGVCPIVHENYDGGDIALPKEGRVLRTEDFPFLKEMKGSTLITTDGSTLLGADDKAGVAEIMTLCEELVSKGLPHGRICVAFTPDEEVGRGTSHFDVQAFGAQLAYTMDGGEVGGIEFENFHAASAEICIKGVSVHPGGAKGLMVNAGLLACELAALLPKWETPAHTEGYEGFFYLESIHADCERAVLQYAVRDHDAQCFAQRKQVLENAAAQLRAKYPRAEITVAIQDIYQNMRQKIEPCMYMIDYAKLACERAGVTPRVLPIRGGTDGAHLSFMGIPCPNLGTGGHNFHGPYECITVQSMERAVCVLHELVQLYAQQS